MRYDVISVTSFHQNCLLIWCEMTNLAVLVDPGGDHERLCAKIDQLGIKLINILLTHGHIDHIGDAGFLRKYYNAPIIGPNKKDKFLLDNLLFQCEILKFNKPIDSAIYPDMWLEDGDQIKVGTEIFDVIHCPGHSPGHVVFWNKKRKFIVMGDVLFKENIGRTDLPRGNFPDLIHSIKEKLFPLGDDVFFFPGHGSPSTIGHERLNNPFLFKQDHK